MALNEGPLLELDGIVKRFGGVLALDGVSLTLDSLIFSTLGNGQFMPVEVQLLTKDNLP